MIVRAEEGRRTVVEQGLLVVRHSVCSTFRVRRTIITLHYGKSNTLFIQYRIAMIIHTTYHDTMYQYLLPPSFHC